MRNSSPRAGGFAPEALSRVLFTDLGLPPTAHFHVAFSGGTDSTALLHALASLPGERLRITALHADHGLAPDSGAWSEHCRSFCERLKVPILVRALDVKTSPARGIEASARHERYRWFAAVLGAGDVLVTAHHRDDQAETVLLRLLRGAGVRGLAGMPAVRLLGAGRLARPLLRFARAELLAYNAGLGLCWIEDPANRDTRFDRVYLRRVIVPGLRRRWPAASQQFAQAAHHLHEASALLDELAAQDLAEGQAGPVPWAPGYRVRAAPLERLTGPRQANALRFLLRKLGFAAPSTSCLERALAALFPSRPRGPLRTYCEGLELRRYDDWLELAVPLPPVPAPGAWKWQAFPEPLAIPELGIALHAEVGDDASMAFRTPAEAITVRLRCGGERFLLPGRAHHRTLKNLLNEARVPPWHRARLPVLYAGDDIAAVPGVCVAVPFACAPGERGWRVQITQITVS